MRTHTYAATGLLAGLSVRAIALNATSSLRDNVTHFLADYIKCPQPNISDLPFPDGQTNLTIPGTATAVQYSTLGSGVQNYTCQNGVYNSTGAVASLYDISCFAMDLGSTKELVSYLPTMYLNVSTPDVDNMLPVMMDHYFAASPSGIAPIFANRQDGTIFSAYQKNASLPASDPTVDVPWLKLNEVQSGAGGNISTTAYRLATAGGQPPQPNCTAEGEQISVKYSALYYFVQ